MKIQKHIKMYETADGKVPFRVWLESLDMGTRSRVRERLDRVALGNLGNYKPLTNGICELKLVFGPGYRIYYAEDGGYIVLLLCAGDKSSQRKDIKKAIAYWKDYLAR